MSGIDDQTRRFVEKYGRLRALAYLAKTNSLCAVTLKHSGRWIAVGNTAQRLMLPSLIFPFVCLALDWAPVVGWTPWFAAISIAIFSVLRTRSWHKAHDRAARVRLQVFESIFGRNSHEP